MTRVLGVSPAHDSSICVIEDGKLQFFSKEERLSKRKRDKLPFLSLEGLDQSSDIDYVAWVSPEKDDFTRDLFLEFIYKKVRHKEYLDLSDEHHLCHASLAFYNSGFKEASVIVIDRNGSVIENSLRESESIFYAKYPCEFESVYKSFWVFDNYGHEASENYRRTFPNCEVVANSMFGVVKVYETATSLISQDVLENGKVMGLSAYGSKYATENIYNHSLNINDSLLAHEFNGKDRMAINTQIHSLKTDKVTKENFQVYADYAYQVQHETQQYVCSLIEKSLKKTGVKNICITGGYALNVVANQFYVKNFPNVNFYFEPIPDDSGTSIGAAMLLYRTVTGDVEKHPLNNLFFNNKQHSLKDIRGKTITTREVAKLMICDEKSVAIYSGVSEAGPRALGNRSILFNASNKNGREIVNDIKKREWYRPFAASVLEEDAQLIFEMLGLQSSPFMTINFQVKEDFATKFPAITHVDGTSRIQTVSKDNRDLYSLLKEIKEITGYGICLNTSFNLAGDPLVEFPEDAISVLNNSSLDYVWFPEVQTLLS